MASQSDIAAAMIAQLKITDPELDTSIGTTTRKMLDAWAEQVAEATIDNQILTYQYDIDSKTEGDLDNFVQLFGLARMPAVRATGTVTFTRTTGGEQNFLMIPVNSEIDSADGSVSVLTLTVGVMEPGELTVTVPVQAVNGGPEGNTAAGTLTLIANPVDGVGTVTNTAALTGGANQETDDQLRQRWKDTVFRSMAGTESMYIGVALNDPDCTAANVVSAAKVRREQVQISSGQAVSVVSDAAYVYTGGVMVGKDLDDGDMAIQGLDYQWDTTVNPPRIVVLSAANLPNGTLVDLEFEYVPTSSRNDPVNNLNNRVDVWCAGTRALDAAQTVVFQATMTFSATTSDTYYTGKFVHPDGSRPTAGNYFIPLSFGPIVTLPDQLSIGGTIYGRADTPSQLGTTVGTVTYAYMIVHQDDAYGYSPKSLYGIEWLASAIPPANSVFSIAENYTYNDVPWGVQKDIDSWRLAGIDALAHQAKQVLLKFNLAVIYDVNADQAGTNTAIDVALSSWLQGLGFNAVVQVSDVIQQIHAVPGVDAVRFLVGADIAGWNSATPNAFTVGVQRMVGTTVVQSYVDTNGAAQDVILGDDEVPVLGSTFIVPKAQNTWAPGS